MKIFFQGAPLSAGCCRFLLSQHPELEAKVLQELQSLGLAASAKNPVSRQLTYADLGELAYLQAVVKVCYPPHAVLYLPCICQTFARALTQSSVTSDAQVFYFRSDTPEGPSKMVPMLCCLDEVLVQETLRMYPPVAIGQARTVTADLSIGNILRLPAGTCAIVPHHAMQSASFNWDKPNEFLPGVSGHLTLGSLAHS